MGNQYLEDNKSLWAEASSSTESVLKFLLWFTITIGVFPFVWYCLERSMGWLQSEAEWQSNQGNHGPWWGTPFELTVCYSLMWLIVLTPIVAMVLSFKDKQYSVFGRGLLLVVLQMMFWVAQFWFLFWTVD